MTPAQKRIERAYQRAMNIRDSSPGRVVSYFENRYGKAYRKAYRNGNAEGFVSETKLYLSAVRAAAESAHVVIADSEKECGRLILAEHRSRHKAAKTGTHAKNFEHLQELTEARTLEGIASAMADQWGGL